MILRKRAVKFTGLLIVCCIVAVITWYETRCVSAAPQNELAALTVDNMTMRHVIVAARHGVRATHAFDPTLYKKSDYPMGKNELTKIGRQQAYDYGFVLREYYKDYLSDDPWEAWSRSCYLRRCYDTAALILASLYPPKGGYVWDTTLNWQPIQVVNLPEKYDIDSEECGAQATKDFLYLFDKPGPPGFDTIKDFIFYVANVTGYSPYETDFFQPIIDNYFLRKWDGLPIPDWAEEKWDAIEWALRRLSFEFHKEVMPFHSQAMMNLVADRLEDVLQERRKKRTKISVLGYHRKNFQGFFDTFDFDRMAKFPRFLASINFELFEHKETKEYYVRIMYSQGFILGGGYQPFEELQLPGCPWPCKLQTMTQVLRNANKAITETCFNATHCMV